MPPVAMITVSFPAFIASRTSIHVMSAMKTVSAAAIGRLPLKSGETGLGMGAASPATTATEVTSRWRIIRLSSQGMSLEASDCPATSPVTQAGRWSGVVRDDMLCGSGQFFVRDPSMPPPSPTPVDLTGCTAIVTGAAQGLGLEMAAELSRGGANVVLADVQVEKARGAAEGLGGSAVELDVTDSQAVGEVFASVAAENGQLDIVVNNAGVGQHLDRISDLPDGEWDRVLAATLTGTFYCGRAAAAIMERQESGAIVNISSINGQNPAALAGAYNVAKAGVISLTRTMALELAAYGVRVNAVCPGPVYTDFNRSVMRQRSESLGIEEQEMVERVRAAVPLGRWGEPRDIARMVAWLASPAADWMTGEVVRVSGGLEGVSAAPPKRVRNDDEETV
ncbi:MAG: hypothetical protein CMJ69_02640 [Planctomycetaceae bacterium]|nr:hypothetical protein [Planctomycetaceae bacterium]